MQTRNRLRLTAMAMLALAGFVNGCAATVEGSDAVEETQAELYGAGDSVLTVVKQNIKFNGSTAPQYGVLGRHGIQLRWPPTDPQPQRARHFTAVTLSSTT
jgi:curli biogenesis system outer membrane secretion channel CsgG